MTKNFSLYADILVKGIGEHSNRGEFSMIASTQSEDLDGETIIQKGLEWGLFMDRGWFNKEHRGGYEYAIGEPTSYELTMHKGVPATRVDGFLYLDDPEGAKAFDKMKMLQKSSDRRRLGGSIEGPVISRDSGNSSIVTRALVTNIAVTCWGKAPNTEAIAKSLELFGKKANASAQALLKAAAGYQDPAGTSGEDAGNFAPLIPQSFAAGMSVATFTGLARKVFPEMTDDEVMNVFGIFQ